MVPDEHQGTNHGLSGCFQPIPELLCTLNHAELHVLSSILTGKSYVYVINAATTLTSWHLMVTFCTLHVAQRLRFFEAKAIDGQTVVLFGLLNGTSIGLLNLSLGFNSIGFYQVSLLFTRYCLY
jgi:hypothetical protein